VLRCAPRLSDSERTRYPTSRLPSGRREDKVIKGLRKRRGKEMCCSLIIETSVLPPRTFVPDMVAVIGHRQSFSIPAPSVVKGGSRMPPRGESLHASRKSSCN
jgi:hypothetical protein